AMDDGRLGVDDGDGLIAEGGIGAGIGGLRVRVTLKSRGKGGAGMFVTVLTIVMRTLLRSHLSTAVGMSKAQSVPHWTSLSGPQLMFGGSVSTMVTVWLQKAALPQVSDVRHVRVTLKIFGQRGAATLVTVATTSIRTL